MGGSYFGIIMPGIAAVVCFFMISGYAMSGLIQGSYPVFQKMSVILFRQNFTSWTSVLFLSCCCCLIVFVVGWRSSVCCQSGPVNFVNIFANITVIPLDFLDVQYIDRSFSIKCTCLDNWTGIVFYIALPWLLYNRVSVWCSAIIGSIVWG